MITMTRDEMIAAIRALAKQSGTSQIPGHQFMRHTGHFRNLDVTTL